MLMFTQIECFQTEFTDSYQMMHKAWRIMKEAPHCFSRSSMKFQGLVGQKIDFDPNVVFPDCK